ncbi:hypothetical protein B0H13DRAFT_1871829 [Mycena leptocephala]|nr:hypothetical protein B0H13DRAFT_1871829 [Mycena leptocephala]
MFEKQSPDAQVPWNQGHFEGLVTKWVAACDQSFVAVIRDEFCEMLQYVHYHSPKRICEKQDREDGKINRTLSLDAWMSNNGYAFLAIVIHYIGNDGKLEECPIGFQELVGEHSGENMAELCGR